MAIKPEEFLTTAKELLRSDKKTESDQRTAISRSYYAMYHKVLSILENGPLIYAGTGYHAGLITYLENSASLELIEQRQLQRLAYQLKHCRSHRVLADYGIQEGISSKIVNDSITTAERCLQLADQLAAAKNTSASQAQNLN